MINEYKKKNVTRECLCYIKIMSKKEETIETVNKWKAT